MQRCKHKIKNLCYFFNTKFFSIVFVVLFIVHNTFCYWNVFSTVIYNNSRLKKAFSSFYFVKLNTSRALPNKR